MSKTNNNFWTLRFLRCILILLIIMVVSGAGLAILNDALYVSAKERASRAIKKIYGEDKEFVTILDVDRTQEDATLEGFTNSKIEYSFDDNNGGTINKIYTIGDTQSDNYDYLFQATGENGYKNGTITIWAQVSFNKLENKYSIVKIILESYTKQTLMSKLGGEYFSSFELIDVTDAYNNGEYFGADSKNTNKDIILNPVSGATKSANAGCNAVNCIIKYVGEELS